MKTLVIYYSQACGNTRRIAEMIHQAIPSDIAEIETIQPYKGSYEDIVEQGKHEVENGTMPAIRPLSVKIEDYDRIILGTPTWWYTMARLYEPFLMYTTCQIRRLFCYRHTAAGWDTLSRI